MGNTFNTSVALSGLANGYASVTDVRQFKVGGQTVDLTAYTDAEVEVDIGLAEAMIEGICNDKFYEQTNQEYRFDGNGLVRLHFQPRVLLMCRSVDTLVEVDLDGTTVLDTFVEDDDFKLYPFYLETARDFPGDSPRRRFGSGGVWPKGQNNIVLTGTWGHEVVPPEIKRATILLVLERLIPGSTRTAPKDVTQAVWNDFTITFKGGEMAGRETGFAEVDRLLMRHVNWINAFQVVPDEKQLYDGGLVDY